MPRKFYKTLAPMLFIALLILCAIWVAQFQIMIFGENLYENMMLPIFATESANKFVYSIAPLLLAVLILRITTDQNISLAVWILVFSIWVFFYFSIFGLEYFSALISELKLLLVGSDSFSIERLSYFFRDLFWLLGIAAAAHALFIFLTVPYARKTNKANETPDFS